MTPADLVDALERERAVLLERYDDSHPAVIGLAALLLDSATALRRLGRVEQLSAAWLEAELGPVPQDVLAWATEVHKRRNALRDALRSGG